MSYKQEVSALLDGKEHVSDGMGSEQFLFFILMACVFFFTMSIGMSIYMVCRRKHKIKKEEIHTLLIEKYQNFLSGFLILPLDDAFLGIQKQNQNEFRLDPKDISDPYRRQVLAKEIYELKKNLSGQQESQLTNYFFGLGLQSEVIKMLKSENWTEKVKAMQMTLEFKIEECVADIRSFVNDKNREVAIHAIIVRMSIEKTLDVLNEVTVELNDWECHKIVSAIKSLRIPIEEVEVLKIKLENGSPYLQRLIVGLIEKEERQIIFQRELI